MRYKVYLCASDLTCYPDDSDCPLNHEHEPTPRGYTDFFEWADEKAKTHENVPCAACGLFKIWVDRTPATT
jgi:hypothetical protein